MLPVPYARLVLPPAAVMYLRSSGTTLHYYLLKYMVAKNKDLICVHVG
jgi:hypothetical protein